AGEAEAVGGGQDGAAGLGGGAEVGVHHQAAGARTGEGRARGQDAVVDLAVRDRVHGRAGAAEDDPAAVVPAFQPGDGQGGGGEGRLAHHQQAAVGEGVGPGPEVEAGRHAVGVGEDGPG